MQCNPDRSGPPPAGAGLKTCPLVLRSARRIAQLFVILTAVALGVTPVFAQGVPGGGVNLFELDGNAVVDDPPADDWANTVPTKSATSEAIASTFIADGSGNTTIFTGGGSKDVNDITSWSWKDQLGGLPDKDNITNAYAAAYINSTGQLIIYFGLDRFANVGDAQLGFWFFKSRVQAIDGKFVGADGVTPATHTDGDVLVLANLTNGGAVVTIQVFQWMAGNLVTLVPEETAKCGTNSDPNAIVDVCAISNPAPGGQIAPWPYTPKSGAAGSFPTFSFFEGGINITAILGPQAECFSSFMAETRSSQSLNAVLKDFALGEFNTCKLDIVKDCPTVRFDSATGTLVYTYNVTVKNSGIATLFDVTVTDTASGGYSKTFTQASLAAGASAVFTDTISLTPGPSTPNPPTNTASVTAATLPGGLKIVTAGPATATCPQVSFDANLTITKTCVTRLEVQGGRVVVAVDISGQVCNVAPAQGFASPIDNVMVTDTPDITPTPISLGTLQPGECKPYFATYFPSTLIGPGVPKDQTFEDTVHVTGTSTLNNQTKQNTATANCPLCPPEPTP
jgi:hypothetical protein